MHTTQSQRANDILKKSTLVYSKASVQDAVSQLAQSLNHHFNEVRPDTLPLVLGVMGGGVVFTGQILPQLTFPLEFDFIHVSRYGDNKQGDKVIWKVVPRQNVKDRTIIVLDDILDEGETLAEVRRRLLDMGAKEVILVVFADKDLPHEKTITADYIGVTVPNKFVIGYGMDIHGCWRNLPEIRAVENDA